MAICAACLSLPKPLPLSRRMSSPGAPSVTTEDPTPASMTSYLADCISISSEERSGATPLDQKRSPGHASSLVYARRGLACSQPSLHRAGRIRRSAPQAFLSRSSVQSLSERDCLNLLENSGAILRPARSIHCAFPRLPYLVSWRANVNVGAIREPDARATRRTDGKLRDRGWIDGLTLAVNTIEA